MPSDFPICNNITEIWEDIAELFNVENIKDGLHCGSSPSEYALALMQRLRDRGNEAKLSTWNEFAEDGHIPFMLEIDGPLEKMGYEEWGYKVKIVPVSDKQCEPQSEGPFTWDAATQRAYINKLLALADPKFDAAGANAFIDFLVVQDMEPEDVLETGVREYTSLADPVPLGQAKKWVRAAPFIFTE